MRSTARETSAALRMWLVFLLATVPAAGVAAAGGGPCFSVSLSDAIVLPDGAIHEPGEVRVCVTHAVSPVLAIHKVYVDREHVAMLSSRVGVGEAVGDGTSVMMFQRDSQGRLHLFGFATPEDGRMTNYLMHRSDFGPPRSAQASRQASQPTFAHDSDTGIVRIATRDSRR